MLEAVEIVTDRVIDNLEKEKDALKEKNDEQQRELDLLEAKNNLEKAKKQKVFVYKEGQGLVQVQDEAAVKEAKQYVEFYNGIIKDYQSTIKSYKTEISNCKKKIEKNKGLISEYQTAIKNLQ